MDISGIVQSYDSRAVSSGGFTRAIDAPHYMPVLPFSAPPATNMVPHPQIQQSPFNFGAYTGVQNAIIPAFAANYIQPRPIPRLTPPATDGRGISYVRSTRPGFVKEIHSQSPPVKIESVWNSPTSTSTSFAPPEIKTISATNPTDGNAEVTFKTEVDTLMKAIQAKTQTTPPRKPSSDRSRPVVGSSYTQAGIYNATEESKLTQKNVQDEPAIQTVGKKRYRCTIPDCNKSFYQKTHLDIHERAHTGIKPYVSTHF